MGSEFAEQEQQLPEEVLCRLSKFPPVQRFVCHADYSFYQALVEVLVPDVLRPIPSEFSIPVTRLTFRQLVIS